ncbi:MAG: RrF2 family transcriptional regulator [Chitinophagaceae bacterium]
MVLSKSFGYALRGVLYVALMGDENRKVPLEEIADNLKVPRHFLAKILKSVVKADILKSTRGPGGGFYIHEGTLATTLLTIVLLIEGNAYFNTCLLSLRKCNASRPCPLHHKLDDHKKEIMKVYQTTTIGDLLKNDKPEFIRSLAID